MEADSLSELLRTGAGDAIGGSGWVTTEVAAKAVRVSPRTIRRYIERGELEAKPQSEGVRRSWLVSVDSLHALRAARTEPEKGPRTDRGDIVADGIADVLRDMAMRLEQRAAEAAELRIRLELTAQAQSTMEEDRKSVLEELVQERECRELAQRRIAELEGKLGAARKLSEDPKTIEEGPERVQSRPPTTGTRKILEGREERRSFWAQLFGG
jgi:hypothetical protein